MYDNKRIHKYNDVLIMTFYRDEHKIKMHGHVRYFLFLFIFFCQSKNQLQRATSDVSVKYDFFLCNKVAFIILQYPSCIKQKWMNQEYF